MENRGFSVRSIISLSLWITLTGSLLFGLATTKGHTFGYVSFFSIFGTLLITLPWIIQLLVTFAVILLYKTKGYDLMWIIHSPKAKENDQTNVVTISSSSSPLSSRQVVKKNDKDEIEIRIVIGSDGPKSPKNGSSATLEIGGRNNTKLLTNGSPVA